MYSSLPTLNNKKITAMFYVHLFLNAMYRKKQKKNLFFVVVVVVFPNICIHLATLKQEAACSRRERRRSGAAAGGTPPQLQREANIHPAAGSCGKGREKTRTLRSNPPTARQPRRLVLPPPFPPQIPQRADFSAVGPNHADVF